MTKRRFSEHQVNVPLSNHCIELMMAKSNKSRISKTYKQESRTIDAVAVDVEYRPDN